MREVLGAGLTFVVLAVVVMIGGAMVVKTQNITLQIAGTGGATLINSLATDTGAALTTLTGLLPLLALAVIGGLSIFYLMGFLGRGGAV